MRGRLFRHVLSRIFRPRSLRHHLMWLVVGVLAPMVAFSAALMWRLSDSQRASAERRQIETARDVADSLDREMASTIRGLEALAQSPRLEADDITAFDSEARRVLGTQPSWASVELRRPDGQAVIDTTSPPGAPLPVLRHKVSFGRVIDTRKPAVGKLIAGRPSGVMAFPIRVPVLQGKELKYVLTATVEPAALMPIVAGSRLPQEEWTRTVVDDAGTIVARTRTPQTSVGHPATPSFISNTRATYEGIYSDTTLEGASAYVAFSRASLSDWTTAVVVPVDVIDGPARRTTLAVAAAGMVMLVISGAGAWLLSRRVAGGIAQAAQAAEQLSHGVTPVAPHSSVREVARLGQAIRLSGELLATRERERAEHLARAESAREEAEAARAIAEAASGAKDQFLAALSHELRTPLTPALAAVQMLEADPRLDAEVHGTLAMIRRNVQLEVKLIDDLLDLTRIARGKLELHAGPVDLHLKVRQAAEICATEILLKQHRLVLQLDAANPVVLGDSARLQQVLWNLLKNAVKFTPEEGVIRVVTRDVSDNQIEVKVSDTGVGIEAGAMDRIFTAFEQGGAMVTRQFGGLGLGLTISRAIVEMHGGSIAAQSGGKGQGATFSLLLPCCLTQPAQEADSDGEGAGDAAARESASLLAGAASGDAAEPLRVLLVEDNADTSAVLARLLKRFGCQVRVANTVASAITQAEEGSFDLLVSDLGLPDGTGYELMHTLRERFALDGSRGVRKGLAISGYGMEEDVRRSLEAGFSEHLTKPVNLARLEQAIRRVAAQPSGNGR